MATRKLTLKGKAMWAKVFEDNRDMQGFEGAYTEFEGAYTIDVILDKENKQKLKDSGSAKKGKFDDDGNFIVKFVRKHKDRFDWASGAPVVTKPDGSPWSFEDDGQLNNLSDIEIDISVYDTAYRPGTRMEEIRVTRIEEIKEEDKVEEESWD